MTTNNFYRFVLLTYDAGYDVKGHTRRVHVLRSTVSGLVIATFDEAYEGYGGVKSFLETIGANLHEDVLDIGRVKASYREYKYWVSYKEV